MDVDILFQPFGSFTNTTMIKILDHDFRDV